MPVASIMVNCQPKLSNNKPAELAPRIGVRPMINPKAAPTLPWSLAGVAIIWLAPNTALLAITGSVHTASNVPTIIQ